MTTQPSNQPKPAEYCSFCGEHRDDVPLIVTSTLNPKVACCCNCAMTMVHQTYQWAGGIFKQVTEEAERRKSSVTDIRKALDPTDEAIERATGQS